MRIIEAIRSGDKPDKALKTLTRDLRGYAKVKKGKYGLSVTLERKVDKEAFQLDSDARDTADAKEVIWPACQTYVKATGEIVELFSYDGYTLEQFE